MDIVNLIAIILIGSLIVLIALLVAVIQCIRLIDKSIRQRESVLHNPAKELPKFKSGMSDIKYPFETKVELYEDIPNVMGYKTQAKADEEKAKSKAPDIEDLLPTTDND